jgi:HEPN domain-containing protein
MQPPDPDTLLVLREWVERADADLHVAEQLAAEAALNLRVREIAGFHCQQAAEKYLKALLTHFQIEFPKTHDLQVLLALLDRVDPRWAVAMREADWLSPFGAKVRYPGDTPEMLPGDERKALDLARTVKCVVSSILDTPLAPK